MTKRAEMDATEAFEAYERARHRLPDAVFPGESREARSLADIAYRYDAYKGELDFQYVEDAYSIRVTWRRDG